MRIVLTVVVLLAAFELGRLLPADWDGPTLPQATALAQDIPPPVLPPPIVDCSTFPDPSAPEAVECRTSQLADQIARASIDKLGAGVAAGADAFRLVLLGLIQQGAAQLGPEVERARDLASRNEDLLDRTRDTLDRTKDVLDETQDQLDRSEELADKLEEDVDELRPLLEDLTGALRGLLQKVRDRVADLLDRVDDLDRAEIRRRLDAVQLVLDSLAERLQNVQEARDRVDDLRDRVDDLDRDEIRRRLDALRRILDALPLLRAGG